MKNQLHLRILFCLFLTAASTVIAAGVDRQLLMSLHSDAEHDQARSGQFKKDRDAKKIYDNEREKELALFLEQQEKWELVRERGLTEYRKRKQDKSPADDGPEYKEDLKLKIAEEKKREDARITVVQTRERVRAKTFPGQEQQELEELNLAQNRPRFDRRKRGKNKWVKGTPAVNSSGGSGGGFAPPPAAFDDFPNQPDFTPTPAIDGFEEIPPPPPPPVNFDGSSGYGSGIDSGFGDLPPPPPMLDDDF